MFTDTSGGGEAWQRFFEARRNDPETTDLARSLWGYAEQTTTDFAHDLVGDGSEREEVFLEYGDTWRKTLRGSHEVRGLDLCDWDWCEPLIFALDPRSCREVRAGGCALAKRLGRGRVARLDH